MFVNVLYFFSLCVWLPVCWCLNVCWIRRCSRQRETSLRGSWSGYYLCSVSATETEQEASIMCGSVTAGAIRDAQGDRSVVHC